MRKAYILVYTLIIVAVASILSVALFTNVAAYVRTNAVELSRNEAYLVSQNILQLSFPYLKPYMSGLRGITLSWRNENIATNATWWNSFKEFLFSQSDGGFWEGFFQRLNENKYFDLSSISEFNQDLRTFTLSGSSVVVPVSASYQVSGNPYSALLVSRGVNGKIEAYSVAVIAIDFLNKYAYFTEREKRPNGETIYFISRDVIDGPMRSNDYINISGSPRFKSSVEVKGVLGTGNPIYEDPFSPKILTQQDIEEYNMNKIATNYSADLNALVKSPQDFINSSEESGINLKLTSIRRGNRTLTAEKLIVEFKSAEGAGNDHFMKVYVEHNGPDGKDLLFTMKPRPDGNGYHMIIHGEKSRDWLGLQGSGGDETRNVNFNGVLKSNLTIALQNKSNNDKPMYVDGRYTLFSEQNVEIYDHVIYEDFRDIFPHQSIDNIVVTEQMAQRMKEADRTDFLNIVARKSVIVKEKEQNLKLTMSIYAFEERFFVEDYNSGSPKGQLTIFGSLMQNYRGPVGTFRGESIVTGYYKNYIYDSKILEGFGSIGTPAKREEILILTLRGVY
ncbi:hypothetical protein ACSFC1_03325 [Pseudothermotoga sp. U03pept]|uniref:hypothetical protein n=1 Tax=Pseudothermotoga sp. U03pept TaxID=3447012 RepID=UPI003EFC2327